MTKAINDYRKALLDHLEAQKEEGVSKDRVRKTRHVLLMAREAMRSMEQEVLEDNLRNL